MLHKFNVSTTGSTAIGELVRAPDGRLYGSAYMGGGGFNAGTIFEITPQCRRFLKQRARPL